MDTLVPDDLSMVDVEAMLAIEKYRKFNYIDFWNPYPKQLEFIALTGQPGKDEFLLTAGNQCGKSDVGAFITACHLTGLYPKGWNGRRWDRPVRMWAAGESTTVVRNVSQRKLLGPPGVPSEEGTGFIPGHCIERHTTARGAVADAVDTLVVKHYNERGVHDGNSTLQFKSYEQGRSKFQGETIDCVWWDEEPPADVYTEGLARTTATAGQHFMTFTPLRGYSEVVSRFMRDTDANSHRAWLQMSMRDALHVSPSMIQSLLSKYPEHEHAARMEGDPKLGSGNIFTIPQSEFVVDPTLIRVPPHWAKIWGIDFGISHPFAAVLLLWDRDNDTIYLWHSWKCKNAIPATHAAEIRRVAGDVPIAWPHDGHVRDKGSGQDLVGYYKHAGLNMLGTHATWPHGGFSTEAGIMLLNEYLDRRRFKVNRDCIEWLDEYRRYHRDEKGQIVKLADDLLSATFKAMMMKRYAKPLPLGPSYANKYADRMAKRKNGTDERLSITEDDPFAGY